MRFLLFFCHVLLCFVCLSGGPSYGQAKLHLLVFADTDDPDIGDANRKTYNYLTGRFGPNSAQYAGLTLVTAGYYGSRCTVSELDKYLNALTVGPDDVVMFYFIGHGWNNRQNEYPSLIFGKASASRATLEANSRNLLDVYERIMSKNPRLALIIGEACNKERSDDPPLTSNLEAIPMKPPSEDPAKFRQLLRGYAGSLVLSSCRRNQFSYSDPKGGWLGLAWQNSVNTVLSDKQKKMPDWQEFISSVVQITERTSAVNKQLQQPQYILTVRPAKSGANTNTSNTIAERPCQPINSYVNETALAGIREDMPLLIKMSDEIDSDNAVQYAQNFERFYMNQRSFYDELGKMLFYNAVDMPDKCRPAFQEETKWVKANTDEITRRYKMVVKQVKNPQQLVAQARSELPSLIQRLEDILHRLNK
ncbi:caspase family protein [Spirosoma linguale]|uniref:Peptidase C14 caspase domain-containing protein n=1 Tax=Spirosoma linguale (strain ATCC 33905 / DSM 74 / LMG 10896 / Claus 1) TaxID=504472 RepID=D2QUE5_SPILD|nr:hypothetical protein Slin_6470 [Spirosoma linguale DSM 74]